MSEMTYAASVPLSRISVHEQVRKDFNGIEELAASLKAQGQKQRILLRVQNEYASHPDGEENFNKLIEDLLKANDIKFDLVCGERRYRAAAFNKWESLNADIQILTDEEAREAQITENLLREDPHPLDESQAIKELVEAGRTFDQISAKLGKDVKFIKRRAGLLLLSKPLKRHFRNNVFGLQVAEILAGFPIAKQNAFAEDHIRKDGKEYYLNMTATMSGSVSAEALSHWKKLSGIWQTKNCTRPVALVSDVSLIPVAKETICCSRQKKASA
jgi:ParB/RepB/Spo0J family partition protein